MEERRVSDSSYLNEWTIGIRRPGRRKTDPGTAVCPRCGTPKDQWVDNAGEGYRKEDRLYCSRDCAEASDPEQTGNA